jgi:hypothetical protein
MPDYQKLRDNVKLSVTGEGLRSELEKRARLVLRHRQSQPNAKGEYLLGGLVREIGQLPNEGIVRTFGCASLPQCRPRPRL